MKRVQITLDDDLVKAVDRVARMLGTSRSAFARDSLREALNRLRPLGMEKRHRAGYAHSPVRRGEFIPPLKADPLWSMAGADAFESAPVDDTVYR